jgi:hypothetical protein
VCSITTNAAVDSQLKGLGASDARMVEKRVSRFAGEANVNASSGLDTTDTHLMRMPEELRDVRKKRIGRHRVYYTGAHYYCAFKLIFIKAFKKDKVNKEDDKAFQDTLIRALSLPVTRTLPDPTKTDEVIPDDSATEPQQPS